MRLPQASITHDDAMSCRARLETSEDKMSAIDVCDSAGYPEYAEAVVGFVAQSKRLYLLDQVLGILCTGVDSHDSPSRYFVAAIQALTQQHSVRLAFLVCMASQVNMPFVSFPHLPCMVKVSFMHVLQHQLAVVRLSQAPRMYQLHIALVTHRACQSLYMRF